jgi:hypothetical protein
MKKHSIFLGAVLLGLLSVLSYAQAPVPLINLPLVPDATAPGGAQFTLTVNGTGFVSSSVVKWNGAALTTHLVSSSQLTATVPAADIATANTASVTVVNSAPGGGTSNAVFFAVAPNVGDSIAFNVAPSVGTGDNSGATAVGDFNGDGKLDFVVANEYENDVSVLLGNGAGGFTLASSPATGFSPRSDVALGDFNNDGKLDMAVANFCIDPGCNPYSSPSTASVLVGDGAGNFTLASSPVVGTNPFAIAAGDFNKDGNLDLAVANYGSQTISILLGDGTGNFTLASSPGAGNPYAMAVGDFNGDGNLDLAVTNYFGDSVSILLGDATGNFTLASTPAAGSNPVGVVAGDFNGDGKLDLAVINLYGPASILLGDGTGNFTLFSSPDVGVYPQRVALGDFNGDGILDLAVPNYYADTVSILLGDGTGNFTLTVSAATGGSYPTSVVIGDFNGDGNMDLAVSNWEGYMASILLGLPPVQLSPTSLIFGTQLVGTASTAQAVTLTNNGTATLSITSITGSANFSQTNNCGSSLAAGASCTINVTFQPQGTGVLTGSITITDSAATSPQKISLTGTGTAVTLLPASLSFGKQSVGTSSAPQTVTLTNHGSKALGVQGIHIAGPDPTDFAETNNCGTSVPAGGSCTISVTFTPNKKGTKTATLDTRDNGGASPQTVALSGTGK